MAFSLSNSKTLFLNFLIFQHHRFSFSFPRFCFLFLKNSTKILHSLSTLFYFLILEQKRTFVFLLKNFNIKTVNASIASPPCGYGLLSLVLWMVIQRSKVNLNIYSEFDHQHKDINGLLWTLAQFNSPFRTRTWLIKIDISR